MYSGQYGRVRLHAAQEGVAGSAKHRAHHTAPVAVVNDERCFNGADSAAPFLGRRHSLHFRDGQAVVLPQTFPLVNCARRIGVLRAPSSQTRVSRGAISRSIFRTSAVRARTAVRAPVAPRLRERRKRQGLFAVRAGSRVHTNTIRQLDQPCHADVLLNLANKKRARK